MRQLTVYFSGLILFILMRAIGWAKIALMEVIFPGRRNCSHFTQRGENVYPESREQAAEAKTDLDTHGHLKQVVQVRLFVTIAIQSCEKVFHFILTY